MSKRGKELDRKMQDIMKLYTLGRIPKISDLDGKIFDVEMYGNWRFMNRDQKVIFDEQGYNMYHLAGGLYLRWGEFDVEVKPNFRYYDKPPDCLYLRYRHSSIRDRLRLDPEKDWIFNGLFCKEKNGQDEIVSVFRLIQRNPEPVT